MAVNLTKDALVEDVGLALLEHGLDLLVVVLESISSTCIARVFLYEIAFCCQNVSREKQSIFVRKTRGKNIDEIDTWLLAILHRRTKSSFDLSR